jgi:hypothetical protein
MNNEPKMKIVQECFLKVWQTLFSIIKIVLLSRPVQGSDSQSSIDDLVVLGNGPSLRKLIETNKYFLEGKDLIAVNYAVLSDYYSELKPRYYVLADPAFFNNPVHCNRVFDNLAAKTDWEMTLFVPVKVKKSSTWKLKLHTRPNIHYQYFNMTPIEGFAEFTHWAFNEKLGMPRPRNVLIPAIMIAMQLNSKHIYVAGADHSWLKDLWIGDDNRLYEDFQHFYDQKSASNYPPSYHLHNMMYNLYITFKSYHIIENYAKTIGKKIYNVTEGSYIDAFERKKI